MNLLAAELRKVRHRLSTWILLVIPPIWVGLLGYLVLYLVVRNPPKGANLGPATPALLRHQLYPDHFVVLVLGQGQVMAAVAVIVGVLTFGSEYGWGTWKLVFTQGPSRLAVYVAKLAAMILFLAVMVAVVLGAGALMATVIGALDGVAPVYPAAAAILKGFGAALLVSAMWAAFGALLAVLMRQSTMAMALGLVYSVVFEGLLASLLAALAPSLRDWLKPLPGANATALFGSFGQSLNGLKPLVSAGQAEAVIGAYLVLFLVVAGVLLTRRDIT